MQQKIRLTESDLHKIVRETVNILRENKALKDTVFIAYGTDAYDGNKFKPYDDDKTRAWNVNKPYGGLWASPLDSKYGWGKWCDSENFHVESLNHHFLFKLKPNANIYTIKTKEDIIKISNILDNWGMEKKMNFKQLIDQGYDGIFVTEEAISAFRFYVEKGIGNLYTWDVPSICVFNSNVIDPIQETAFDKEKISRYEEEDLDDEFAWEDDIRQGKKTRQMASDFGKYANQNINSDMSKLFNGEHPAILAQGHGNNQKTKLARKFNGTIKSGL